MSNLTAAFMGMGMAEDFAALQAALTQWDGGHVELTSEMMNYVEFTDALAKACWDAKIDRPGMYLYEVVEPFGTWFVGATLATGKAQTPPDHVACCTKLREMAFDFYAQGTEDLEPIRRVIASVPNPKGLERGTPWQVKTFARPAI